MKLAVVLALVAVAFAGPVPNILAPNPTGQKYAILVAGSNTWSNYRHQADVCHAYQVLIEHGFDKANIIVMMYDDIAQNPENPTKGTIINQPDGPNVYTGVKIDYKGNDVNPQTFLNVLKGNAEALVGVGSGRVLQSGPNDNVFINFVDHGGPQIIAFQNEFLHASDLISALQYMHTNQKYKQLVFYLEACESGSMFNNLLPADINIFATTASTPTTSSYAIYFDNTLRTYLGDVYSVVWMQNSDASNLNQESLAAQYTWTKAHTNTSVVCEYGDMSMGTEMAGEFLGSKSMVDEEPDFIVGETISSRDVPVSILEKSMELEVKGSEAYNKLQRQLVELIKHREAIRATYLSIATLATSYAEAQEHLEAKVEPSVETMKCVEVCLDAFHAKCFNYGREEYALEHAKSFTSMCAAGVSPKEIVRAIEVTCPVKKMTLAEF